MTELPLEKTFGTLQLERFPPAIRQQVEHLRSGAFVGDAINVIAVGRPGAGKSHVLAALGHELVLRGHPVLWTTTASLVQRLLAAKRDLRLLQVQAQLDRYACLILDDIGYVQHDRDEMEVLFTLLAERYERRSVALSTNLIFSEWERIGVERLGQRATPGYQPRPAKLHSMTGHSEPARCNDVSFPGHCVEPHRED